MQHLVLVGHEYAQLETHKQNGYTPRQAALLVRPDLLGKEFSQNNIHITIWGNLPIGVEDEMPVLPVMETPQIDAASVVEEASEVQIPVIEQVVIRLCEVPGCERKHHAKNLCKKHYKQVYERGTPLNATQAANNTA